MTAERGSPAQAFVQHIDIPGPGPEVPARREVVFDAATERTFIVGSDIVAFVRAVPAEQRSDVVNALLLAQLVAKKKVPEASTLDDVLAWYESYFNALSNIGFSVRQRSFTEYRGTDDTFEAQEVIRNAAIFLNELQNDRFNAALNELMSLFTPARWAYDDIEVTRGVAAGKDSLELKISGSTGSTADLLWNTAELNVFTLDVSAGRRSH